jgi:hypothetical protein
VTSARIDELRAKREATVRQHVEAENRHDAAGVVASFAEPRNDVAPLGELGQAHGGEAIEDLLNGMFAGFPTGTRSRVRRCTPTRRSSWRYR